MQRDVRATCCPSTLKGLGRRTVTALLGVLAVVIVGLSLQSNTASAQSSGAYNVRDVQVTKTGSTGLAAQDLAVREARDKAMVSLLRRLTPESRHASLPVLLPDQVDSMVIATDIQSEQVTSTAYTGTLAITFSPPAVRQILEARQIPYTDTVSPPLIIVPVFERAGALQLWEIPNAWDSAWRAKAGSPGMVQTVIAKGEPAEQLVISADQALAGDAGRLQALAQKYGARGALVAHAKFRIDPRTGSPALDAAVKGYGAAPAGPLTRTFVGTRGLAGGADQAAEDLSNIAVPSLMESLEANWKAQNLRTASVGTDAIEATAALTHLGQFGGLLRQLREIPAVSSFALKSLTAVRAVFLLQLRGGSGQAQAAFSQYGMSLTQTPDGWSLQGG